MSEVQAWIHSGNSEDPVHSLLNFVTINRKMDVLRKSPLCYFKWAQALQQQSVLRSGFPIWLFHTLFLKSRRNNIICCMYIEALLGGSQSTLQALSLNASAERYHYPPFADEWAEGERFQGQPLAEPRTEFSCHCSQAYALTTRKQSPLFLLFQ